MAGAVGAAWLWRDPQAVGAGLSAEPRPLCMYPAAQSDLAARANLAAAHRRTRHHRDQHTDDYLERAARLANVGAHAGAPGRRRRSGGACESRESDRMDGRRDWRNRRRDRTGGDLSDALELAAIHTRASARRESLARSTLADVRGLAERRILYVAGAAQAGRSKLAVAVDGPAGRAGG